MVYIGHWAGARQHAIKVDRCVTWATECAHQTAKLLVAAQRLEIPARGTGAEEVGDVPRVDVLEDVLLHHLH